MDFSLTITSGDDTPPPGGGDIDGILQVREAPSHGPFLARACMPLSTPVPYLQLSGLDVTVGGVPAQLEPVSLDAAGNVDVVEVISLQPGGSGEQQYQVTGEDPTPFGPTTLPDVDLSQLALFINPANQAVNMRATLLETQRRIVKPGPYVEETAYWSRFRGGGEVALGVRTYVTRRADSDVIELTVWICNGICDPAAGSPTGTVTDSQVYRDPNPTVTGRFFWTGDLTMSGVPSGYNAIADVQRFGSDIGNGIVLAQVAQHTQFMQTQHHWVRRYALYPDGSEAEAREILAMRGWGRMKGPSSYYGIPAWGTQKSRLPLLTNGYNYNGTLGEPGAVLDAQNRLSTLEGNLESGVEDPGGAYQMYVPTRGGWSHPIWQSDPGSGSGVYIAIYGWFQNDREEFMAARHTMAGLMERNPILMLHPSDGRTLDPGAFALANQVPGQVGQLPFDAHQQTTSSRFMPWLVDRDDPGAGSNGRPVATFDKPWNDNEPGFAFPQYFAQLNYHQSTSADFGPFDEKHTARMMYAIRPCIWGFNDTVAKEMAQAQGFWNQWANHVPYRHSGQLQTSNQAESLINNIEELEPDPYKGNSEFGRGPGWTAEAISMAYCVAADGQGNIAARTALEPWREIAWRYYDLSSINPTRVTQIIGQGTSTQPDPFEQGGPTDFAARTGSWPSNTIGDWRGFQTFEMSILLHGIRCLRQRCYLGAPVQGGAVDAEAELSRFDDMVDRIFHDVRAIPSGTVFDIDDPDNNVPEKDILCTENLSGAFPAAFPAWRLQGSFTNSFRTNSQRFYGLQYAHLHRGGQLYLETAAKTRGNYGPLDTLLNGEEILGGLSLSSENATTRDLVGLAAEFLYAAGVNLSLPAPIPPQQP